jgi:hypothetical protein
MAGADSIEVLEAALVLSNPNRVPAVSLEDFDLNEVVRCAHGLGTSNAVIWQIERAGLGGRLDPFHREYAADQFAKSMVSAYEADAAVEALDRAGIAVVALKGYAFASTLYADHPEVRGMADIDILIERPTFGEAEAALAELGWIASRTSPVTSRLSVELSFFKVVDSDPPLPLALDVHRRLTTPWRYTIDHRGLWSRATRGSGAVAGVLDPVDALLHLAVHKAQEGYRNQIRDVVDAANLIDLGMAWPDLVERARAWSCTATAWLFLSRAANAVAADVPAAVLRALEPGRIRRSLFDRIFPDAGVDPGFVRELNSTRPQLPKIVGALVATDVPAREATALAAISLRKVADGLVRAVPWLEPACRVLEKIPL